jgi:hypothetical protein
LLHQEHFLSTEDKAAVEGTQETKQNSPKSNPHETGSLIEGASLSKEEATEIKNTTEDQSQLAANGEIHLLCHVLSSSSPLLPTLYYCLGTIAAFIPGSVVVCSVPQLEWGVEAYLLARKD